MRLHFFLPLFLALDQTIAFSTRNLQDVTNDTIPDDENFTKPIPMLFDSFWGNETEFINASDANGTFIIPVSWLRGGSPTNDSTFIQFAAFNDTFVALPSDFNLTDLPPDIRFKNVTEIMPTWRGGGDDNLTLIAMPDVMPDIMTTSSENLTLVQDFFTTTSFDPNGTLPVFEEGDGNLTLIAMSTVLSDNMTTSSENITVAQDNVTTTSFEPNSTLPVLEEGDGNLTVIATPTVLPEIITSSENITVVQDNVTTTSFDPISTLPVLEEGDGNLTLIAMPTVLPANMTTSSENVTVVQENITTTSIDPNSTLPVLGVGVPVTNGTGELPGSASVGPQAPLWLSLVKKLFKDDDLKLCARRKSIPPVSGEKCSKRKDKTCYFGKKSCPDVAEYPETRCKCGGPKSNRTWTCVITACP